MAKRQTAYASPDDPNRRDDARVGLWGRRSTRRFGSRFRRGREPRGPHPRAPKNGRACPAPSPLSGFYSSRLTNTPPAKSRAPAPSQRAPPASWQSPPPTRGTAVRTLATVSGQPPPWATAHFCGNGQETWHRPWRRRSSSIRKVPPPLRFGYGHGGEWAVGMSPLVRCVTMQRARARHRYSASWSHPPPGERPGAGSSISGAPASQPTSDRA
jgi:hypothetical protein